MAAERIATSVTIGLIQTSVAEDRDYNLKNTIEWVKEAAGMGAKIVCLQELYRTRYFPQWIKGMLLIWQSQFQASLQMPFPDWPERSRL